MKLGVNIRNYGPTATPESLSGWLRFAEGAGFTLGMMSDHVASTPDVEELYPAPFYDPFATLAWLAGQTERLELGTTVAILPFRHPLHTARLAANIDRFSGGRFILGVGVGWAEQEYTALGVPFRERGRITDEYLAAIKAAWTADQVSAAGRYLAYSDVATGPQPVRSPHPPVWVGGTSPAAIRRAARFGDAWHPNNAELTWLREIGMPSLRREAEALGRAMPAFSPRLRARLSAHDLPEEGRLVGVGSIAQILADLETLVELGADYITLDANPDHPSDERSLADDWRDLETVAKHALSAF